MLSKNKYFKKINYKFRIKNLSSLVKNYEVIINCDPSYKITKQYFSKK